MHAERGEKTRRSECDDIEFKVQYMHGGRAGNCAWLKFHHLFEISSRPAFDSLQGLDLSAFHRKQGSSTRDASKAELVCLCDGVSMRSFYPPSQVLPSYIAAEAGHVNTRPHPLYEPSSSSQRVGVEPAAAARSHIPMTLDAIAERSQDRGASNRFTAEVDEEARSSAKISFSFLLDASQRLLNEGGSSSSKESERAETSEDRACKSLSDSSKGAEHYADRWVLANNSKGYVVFCKDRDDDKKRHCGILVQELSDESNPSLRVLCKHGCVSLPQFAKLCGRLTKHPKTYIRVFKFGSASLYNLEKDDNTRQVYRGIAQVRKDEKAEARAPDACFYEYLERFEDEAKLCQEVESGVALGGKQSHVGRQNPVKNPTARQEETKAGASVNVQEAAIPVSDLMEVEVEVVEEDMAKSADSRAKSVRSVKVRGKESEEAAAVGKIAAAADKSTRRLKRNSERPEAPNVQTRNKRTRSGVAAEGQGTAEEGMIQDGDREAAPVKGWNAASAPNSLLHQHNLATRSPSKRMRAPEKTSVQGGRLLPFLLLDRHDLAHPALAHELDHQLSSLSSPSLPPSSPLLLSPPPSFLLLPRPHGFSRFSACDVSFRVKGGGRRVETGICARHRPSRH